MKPLKFRVFFLVSLISSVHLFANATNGKEPKVEAQWLFQQVRKAYHTALPQRWLAYVKGLELSESLQKIPKEAYCQVNEPLKVLYLSIRDEGDVLVVQNVQNPYVTRFQNQLNLYRGVRFFIHFAGSFDELQQSALWQPVRIDSKHYVVKARKRFLSEDRFFLLFFDVQHFLLRRVEQYQNQQRRASVRVDYRLRKPFWLLRRIHMMDELSKKQLDISFDDYQLGESIQSNWLVELQNDCAKLD